MYYTGTEKQCQDYNDLVKSTRNYTGMTKEWANVINIEELFYIEKHPDVESEMLEVLNLPLYTIEDYSSL